MNAFLESMEMTKIPSCHYYNFQKDYLHRHIIDKMEKQIASLHANAKANKERLVLEFDARHASV